MTDSLIRALRAENADLIERLEWLERQLGGGLPRHRAEMARFYLLEGSPILLESAIELARTENRTLQLQGVTQDVTVYATGSYAYTVPGSLR